MQRLPPASRIVLLCYGTHVCSRCIATSLLSCTRCFKNDVLGKRLSKRTHNIFSPTFWPLYEMGKHYRPNKFLLNFSVCCEVYLPNNITAVIIFEWKYKHSLHYEISPYLPNSIYAKTIYSFVDMFHIISSIKSG